MDGYVIGVYPNLRFCPALAERIVVVSGGRCRIRTCDFHRVNLATVNAINNLQRTDRSCKSLKRQTAHNNASLIVHELCMKE